MTLPVALLVGGFGTRLFPMTQTKPKALLQVAGKPFIEWQLEYLLHHGVQRVVLCVGHLGAQIQATLGDGARFGLELLYSFDGPSPLGTGGALKRALPLLGESFFVLYGDSYLTVALCEMESAFMHQEKPLLMSVYRNINQRDVNNVRFEHDQLLEYNKTTSSPAMHHIDYGLSILSSSLFDDYSLNEPFDLADFYKRCSGVLGGYEVFSRFYEIGSPEGLQETTDFLSKRVNHGLYTTTSERGSFYS